MNGLANIFEVIGSDPMTKWIVALFALRAIWSLIAFKRCPLMTGKAPEIAPGENKGGHLIRHSSRFLIVMVLGIVLAVVGLFRLAEMGEGAPVAVLMLVLGMYLITTEPARFNIKHAEEDIAAMGPGAIAQLDHNRAVLRGGHVKLLAIEFGLVILFVVAMYALSGSMAGMG